MKKHFIFILLFFLLHNISVLAEDGYKVISPAIPTKTGDKIEVLEFFWYGCSHCYNLEPYADKWLKDKPDDVEFIHIPGVFSKRWIAHAKAFYTAKQLGVLDLIHKDLFIAIHVKRQSIFDENSLKRFFAEKGVNKNKFSKVYNSDEINNNIKQAFIAGQKYKLTGVPAVIVNGKYLVNGQSAGGYENLFTVVDKLIEKERKNHKRTEDVNSNIVDS